MTSECSSYQGITNFNDVAEAFECLLAEEDYLTSENDDENSQFLRKTRSHP